MTKEYDPIYNVTILHTTIGIIYEPNFKLTENNNHNCLID